MKGCYFVIFAILDLIGAIFIAAGVLGIKDEECDISTKVGAVCFLYFFAFIFFLPNIIYIVNYIQRKRKRKENNNETNLNLLYPGVTIAPTIINENFNDAKEDKSIFFSKDIQLFINDFDLSSAKIIIQNSSDESIIIYVSCSLYTEGKIFIFDITKAQPSFSKFKKFVLEPRSTQEIVINWIEDYKGTYEKVTKIRFLGFKNSYFNHHIFDTSFVLQYKDSVLYFSNPPMPDFDDSILRDNIFTTILSQKSLSEDDKQLLLLKMPIKYSIEQENEFKELKWCRDKFNNWECSLGHRWFIPQYKSHAEKVLAVYYDKKDDNHNYVKGDKWIFKFESGESVVLEVLSPSKKINNDIHDRMLVLLLKEADILKFATETLSTIKTQNIDTYAPTVNIMVEEKEPAWKTFHLKKIFELYTQAIQKCGYEWGKENDEKFLDNEIKSSDCYVYLMHDEINHFYKIGISNNPNCREKTLQSEKPSIVLIKAKKFPTRAIARAFESALHKTYSDKHIRGEWFNLNEKDTKDIIIALD